MISAIGVPQNKDMASLHYAQYLNKASLRRSDQCGIMLSKYMVSE